MSWAWRDEKSDVVSAAPRATEHRVDRGIHDRSVPIDNSADGLEGAGGDDEGAGDDGICALQQRESCQGVSCGACHLGQGWLAVPWHGRVRGWARSVSTVGMSMVGSP